MLPTVTLTRELMDIGTRHVERMFSRGSLFDSKRFHVSFVTLRHGIVPTASCYNVSSLVLLYLLMEQLTAALFSAIWTEDTLQRDPSSTVNAERAHSRCGNVADRVSNIHQEL